MVKVHFEMEICRTTLIAAPFSASVPMIVVAAMIAVVIAQEIVAAAVVEVFATVAALVSLCDAK